MPKTGDEIYKEILEYSDADGKHELSDVKFYTMDEILSALRSSAESNKKTGMPTCKYKQNRDFVECEKCLGQNPECEFWIQNIDEWVSVPILEREFLKNLG